MLTTAAGTVTEALEWGVQAQELTVKAPGSDVRRALNYIAVTGRAELGDLVLLNTTANSLGLGTGGFDFVIANLTAAPCIEDADRSHGHIIKGRYLPTQLSVLTLEEQDEHASLWDRDLGRMPVLAGQLHSQLIPAAAGLIIGGAVRVVYIMTDAAALPLAFSRAVPSAKAHGLICASITCRQAFGGDYETVTLHSALLAARHLLNADAVVVTQGPGNAGTATRYGFSGVEQASILDTASALGGIPYAIVRMSSADPRERHCGVSHHTQTALRLVRSRCRIPLPSDAPAADFPPHHEVLRVEHADRVLDSLTGSNLPLSTMGRSMEADRVFFLAAAAAGLAPSSFPIA